MPTTRKQKKARKSRGIEMLSDIENIDIMLGENHLTEMNEMKVSVAIKLEGLKVPLMMNSKTMMKIDT